MDEASRLLEDIIFPKKRLPTGYCKLPFDIPLVDQVVDPTLSLKSEDEVIDPSPSLVDPTLSLEGEEQIVCPTLPLKSEVKLVELMSSPPDHTLSSESVNIEVVSLTQSLFGLLSPNQE